jgi:peptidoglycan/xylan/chitin deacetylase (PgdA/CDA1 family)
MARLLARNFNVLPLREAIQRLQVGTLPAAAAAVTFDDGYADNLEVAWPILKRHGIPATFFIATAFLDGGRMWNDEIIEAARIAPAGTLDLSTYKLGTHDLDGIESRIACYDMVLSQLKYFDHDRRTQVARVIGRQAGVPEDCSLMMTPRQLLALRASGADIGAHTCTHPILELMDDDQAYREIATGKRELEAILGESVQLFAYPNGIPGRDCSERHGEMARRLGFEAAVTTSPHCTKRSADPYHLPRFTPWDRTPTRFALRCLQQSTRSYR